jgi:proline- and glutamine-rich splicing factor
LCEGFVDFSRKNVALAAHKFCSEKCYFITSDLRPIITEMGDMNEVDEGLLEINMPKREYGKDRELVYYKAREVCSLLHFK